MASFHRESQAYVVICDAASIEHLDNIAAAAAMLMSLIPCLLAGSPDFAAQVPDAFGLTPRTNTPPPSFKVQPGPLTILSSSANVCKVA